jgi:hypothetical protein
MEAQKQSFVWPVQNPLKQVICNNTYTYNINSKSENSKFYVPIVKDYMDLSKGVWNVSLDTYVIKNNGARTADTILDISTNMVSGFLHNRKENTNNAQNICLGKIFLICPAHMTIGGPFEKKWFTVSSNREFCKFEIFVQQNHLSTVQTSLELEFEMTFMFQRIV